MVTRDVAFGHRDPITFEPTGDINEWIDWDYHLAGAHSIIEAYTDSNGLREWTKKSKGVRILAESKIDEFQAAVQSITNKSGRTAPPGEYFVPKVQSTRDDGELPTYAEWRQQVLDGAFEEKEVDGPRLDKMK